MNFYIFFNLFFFLFIWNYINFLFIFYKNFLFIYIPYFSIYFKNFFFFDFFSFFIIFVFFFVFFVCYYIYNKQTIVLFLLYCINLFMFLSADNIFIFLLNYEVFLILSYFFIFFNNFIFNKIKILKYFIFWSQISSIIIIFCCCYIYFYFNIFLFSSIKLFKIEIFWLNFFLFIGFGLKIGIWPMNFWLINFYNKISINLTIFFNSFFSKIAIFGIYKFYNFIFFNNCKIFIFIIIFFSIFDSCIKICSQISFKKLIIFLSIQEMNFICFSFIHSFLIFNFLFFIFSHSIISIIFFIVSYNLKNFFLSDSLLFLQNISNFSKVFFFIILILDILFSGLPGTIKFFSEFIFFSNLFIYSIYLFIFLLLCVNFFSIIFLNKFIFSILFGLKKLKKGKIELNINFFSLFILNFVLFYFVSYEYYIVN